MTMHMSRLLPFNRSTIGIDWNDEYIKIVELTTNRNGRHLVKNFIITPLPAGVVEDGVINDERRLIRAIRKAFAERTFKAKKVHAVLPGTAVIVRSLIAPDVEDKLLRKWIDYELKHHIYLPFDEPVYDYIKLNRVSNDERNELLAADHHVDEDLAYFEAAAVKEQSNEEANSNPRPAAGKNETEILLIAAARETVNQYQRILKQAGLKMKSIEIKSLTMYRFIQTFKLTEPDDTFIAIDVHRTSSDFALFHQGQLRLTRNAVITFPDEQQSELKEVHSRDHFLNACELLADEIERLMNFFRYSSRFRDQQFQYVLISSDLKRFDPLINHLQKMLAIEIRPMTADRIVLPLLLEQEHVLPSIVTPIGLALRGNKG